MKKLICLDCHHAMPDGAEPDIVGDDDMRICSKCHSKHIAIGCDWCNRKSEFSISIVGGTKNACQMHKMLLVVFVRESCEFNHAN